MRVATFNVQNMRLRKASGDVHLDGARDRDVAEDTSPEARRIDVLDRRLTASVLRAIDADVVALQEVFDQATLDHFHDRFLVADGFAPYPQRICLPGNDGHGLDVALLSRFPVSDLRSHASLTPRDLGLPDAAKPDAPVFRRDCLMATVGRLTFIVCHLKAPYPDPASAWSTRRLEAAAIRQLIEQRFPPGGGDYWLIVGDLNEPHRTPAPADSAVAPLLAPFSVDLMDRMAPDDRWTYRQSRSGIYDCPDAMLASPALARDWPDACPRIVRCGMGREAAPDDEPGLDGVGWHRPHASDHAAVWIDLDGL